jgi:murein L,D-transpeptidase YcbB/YkuD
LPVSCGCSGEGTATVRVLETDSPTGGLRPAALVVVLLVVAACGTSDPIPRRLAERLKSVAGTHRPDLSRDEVEGALARQLRSVPVPAEGGASSTHPIFPTRETLAAFYEGNGQQLAWCDEAGKLLPSSATLLDALRRAGEHGMDPEDYALSRLDLLAASIGKGPFDDAAVARLADFDLLMTAAFFRYAADLSTGRVHPDEIRNDWHTNSPELDPLTKLDEALDGDNLPGLLADLSPPHEGYVRLCRALTELRAVEAAGGWPVIPEGPKLERGSRGPRVAVLRQRLVEPAGELFDETLAEALRRAQERHGIEPDGKLGAATLAELNVPANRRIGQVELNLERWRWIPRELGDPHVFVNIPGFELELVRGGVHAWRTRIVVGKAFSPTPVFSDRIVTVVINPPWNVPKSIAVGEYLPELRKDRNALKRHGLRLLQGSEDNPVEIDPTTVNWRKLGEGDFPYRLRQDPGPDNALGRVKFQLTNEFHVYLHDTPTRALFGKLDRDLSHGCMRVESPLDLARQLLGESSQALLHEALDQTKERHLSVKPPVPIHILYLTAWVDDAGALHFSPDIYEFDVPQRSALDRVASRVSGGPASGAKEATRPSARRD